MIKDVIIGLLLLLAAVISLEVVLLLLAGFILGIPAGFVYAKHHFGIVTKKIAVPKHNV